MQGAMLRLFVATLASRLTQAAAPMHALGLQPLGGPVASLSSGLAEIASSGKVSNRTAWLYQRLNQESLSCIALQQTKWYKSQSTSDYSVHHIRLRQCRWQRQCCRARGQTYSGSGMCLWAAGCWENRTCSCQGWRQTGRSGLCAQGYGQEQVRPAHP